MWARRRLEDLPAAGATCAQRDQPHRTGQRGDPGPRESSEDRYQSFSVRTESLTSAEQNELQLGPDAVDATAGTDTGRIETRVQAVAEEPIVRRTSIK
jgi:hypothetical protein